MVLSVDETSFQTNKRTKTFITVIFLHVFFFFVKSQVGDLKLDYYV